MVTHPNRSSATQAYRLLLAWDFHPLVIRAVEAHVCDVNILDEILPEAGAFSVMDRGYIDFARLYEFTLSSAFFVVRTKENLVLQRRYSRPVDQSVGLRSDHTVV